MWRQGNAKEANVDGANVKEGVKVDEGIGNEVKVISAATDQYEGDSGEEPVEESDQKDTDSRSGQTKAAQERKTDEKEVEDFIKAEESTGEERHDSGLGTTVLEDDTGDLEEKAAEGRSGEEKQADLSNWRVLILWTDPGLHEQVKR